MSRILIITMNWVGDVLFTTPAIRAIKNKFPHASIDVLVVPWAKDILLHNVDVNETILYDMKGIHKGFFGKLRLVKCLRDKTYDCVFLMHRSKTQALLMWLAGIPHRIGYNTKRRGIFLTKSLEPPREDMHMVEYYLGIVKGVNIPVERALYSLSVGEQEKEWVHTFLEKQSIQKDDILIIINPGGNWKNKRWPIMQFASLADRCVMKLGVKIIITGGRKDIPLAEQISQNMQSMPVIAAGETTLQQLTALVSLSDLYIGNDSGPTHIANAVSTPVIALFGPTHPGITGPYGIGKKVILQKSVGCQIPCHYLGCPQYRCMEALSVEAVFDTVCNLLKESNPHKLAIK
ncbi:lipopolysaccharide heptosyltransferase II [Chlamydiota bacterium]